MRIKDHRGDTIVEILIALTVIGVLLSGGYAIATRSLKGIRIAQERSEATKVAERQAELLKQEYSTFTTKGEVVNPSGPDDPFVGFNSTWIAATGSNPAGQNTGFCVVTPGVAKQMVNMTPADTPNEAKYASECKFGRYNVFITTTPIALGYQPSYASGDSLQLTNDIYVTWEKYGGGTEQLKMQYRYTL